MPLKGRKLSDLSDEELEAERKRRKAAAQPKHVNVIRMTEEQFQRLMAEQTADDDDDEDETDDEEESEEPEPKGGYFS